MADVRIGMVVLCLLGAVSAQDRVASLDPRPDALSWRVWWEFNRESHRVFRAPPTAGRIGRDREAVRKALLSIARDGDQANRLRGRMAISEASLGDIPRLRVAAIIALGRLGDDRDAWILIAMLDNPDERDIVKAACALALAARPPTRNAVARRQVRDALVRYLTTGRMARKDKNSSSIVTMEKILPSIPHAMTALTAGIVARNDKTLVAALIGAAKKPPKSTTQYAAALALGCGLAADPMLAPELASAARGKFAGKKFADAPRAQAVTALARLGPTAAPLLLEALVHGGLHTRRSAALGLGRILRAGRAGRIDADVEAALAGVLAEKGRPLLAGYAAIALGGAEQPRRVDRLIEVLLKPADTTRRPYFALAVGLAARNAEEQLRRGPRDVLVAELARAKEREYEAALAIAVGLARAQRGVRLLEVRAERATHPVVRKSAIQGLGLIGMNRPSAPIGAFRERRIDLVEDAAVSLFQQGDPTVGDRLRAALRNAKGSRSRQAYAIALIQAAARLRVVEVVPKLVRQMMSDKTPPRLREASAIALGFLASRAPRDPLLEFHADLNFHVRPQPTAMVTWLCGAYQTLNRPKTNARSAR